jgi:hypothetical protein
MRRNFVDRHKKKDGGKLPGDETAEVVVRGVVDYSSCSDRFQVARWKPEERGEVIV